MEGSNEPCPDGIKLPAQNKFFIEMEYCNGNSLRGGLASYQGKIRKIGKILTDVTKGLAFIHEKGEIHGDLKPENVRLVVKEGFFSDSLKSAKIWDLSFARSLAGVSRSRNDSGKPYWAPEQVAEKKFDSKADIPRYIRWGLCFWSC